MIGLVHEVDAALDPDTIGRLLGSREVVLVPGADGRTVPRPRRVEGEAAAQVARIRPSSDGSAMHLWASQDDVQASAVAAGRVLEGLLRRRGLLDEAG